MFAGDSFEYLTIAISFMIKSKKNTVGMTVLFYSPSQHAEVDGRPSCAVVSFVSIGDAKLNKLIDMLV